jgi:hypothetical protein
MSRIILTLNTGEGRAVLDITVSEARNVAYLFS